MALGSELMKYGFKRKMTKNEKVIYSIIFILFGVYILRNYEQQDFQNIIISIALIIPLMLALDMRWWRNKDKPQFEIKNDKLIFKNSLGSLREYPLINFIGKVETIGHSGTRLTAPKLTECEDTIYIGVPNKKERKAFIDALKAQVYRLCSNQK